MAQLTYTRGDDKTIGLTFTDSDGSAIDITGWKLWLTVKAKATESDDEAVIQVTQTSHSDPTNGKSSIKITSDSVADTQQPGEYVYDIQAKKDNGDIVTVVKPFKFVITEDVTKATA